MHAGVLPARIGPVVVMAVNSSSTLHGHIPTNDGRCADSVGSARRTRRMDTIMTPLYLFALSVGAPLLLWFVFSGGDGVTDVGDTGGLFPWLSLSALAFVAAFFGASGLLLTWLGVGTLVALIAAVVIGVMTGAMNSVFFAWLRRSGVSSDVSDRDIEGAIARVALPISPKRRGRIVLDIPGERIQMTARSVDGGGQVDIGNRVIVVGIESNVALCAPLDPDLE